MSNSPTLNKRKNTFLIHSDDELSDLDYIMPKKIHTDNQTLKKEGGPVVFWFRKDLRTTDNTGLYRASVETHVLTTDTKATNSSNSLHGALISIFVICGHQWTQHDMAPVKLDFLFRNLDSLQVDLETKFRIPLVLLTAASIKDVPNVVRKFCIDHNVKSLHYNIEYEVDELKRDEELKVLLSKDSISVFEHHDECVVAPHLVQSKERRPYTVYTPFRNAWYQVIKQQGGSPDGIIQVLKGYPEPHPNSEALFKRFPASFKRGNLTPNLQGFQAYLKLNRVPDPMVTGVPGYTLSLLPSSTIDPIRKMWPAGEKAAQTKLSNFSSEWLHVYKEKRDIPSLKATSSLSTYLASGIISARQCVLKAYTLNKNQLDAGNPNHVHWISEVAWREFYRYILVHFPRVCKNRPFKLETEAIVWNDGDKAQEAFQRWCEGRTGFPIVDAGMRQLNQTGWMHNRLRMIAASFLVKDLLIDWRWGEKYFMQHLIDGDLASNNGGWQWSASTGTDPQPYFRIFNPLLQSTKFDPDGEFIKTFVHELADVPPKYIHEPHLLPPSAFKRLNYPMPMVDHKVARNLAIDMFKKLKTAV